MKRIFIVLLLVALCASLFGLTAFAEDVAVPEDTPTVAPEPTPEDTVEVDPVEKDFFDRVIEMIDEGKIYELATLVASAIFIALAYVLKKAISNFSTKITGFGNKVSEKVQEGSDGTAKAVNEGLAMLTAFTTDAESRMNGLIAENEMKVRRMVESTGLNVDTFKMAIENKMDELGKKFEEKIAANTRETMKAEQILADVAKILDIVYMGSSTIPSITKERVMAIYDHAEKTMNQTEDAANDAAV